MKVMVTGAGALLGQGIIKSLKAARQKIEIIALDPSPLAAGLYWADRHYLLPMAADPSFLPVLEGLVTRERPHFLLPGTDVELALLAGARPALEQRYGVRVLVSSPEVIAIADDKYLTYRFLREHGFPYPCTCLPGEEEALIEELGFPLIIKPRVGARAVGVYKVQNRDELRYNIRRVANPLVQEYLGRDEEEYTAGALVFEGRCEASIVMRRDLRDGNTHRAYVDRYPELNREVARLGEALKPYGPANFQFRVDQGQVKVFEINARFSGTTPMRALAGFNEVEAALERIAGGKPVIPPEVQPVTIVRYWEEMILPPGATGGRAGQKEGL